MTWENFIHSLPLHQEMQLESLLLNEKAIHLFNAEMLLSSLGPSSSHGPKQNGNMWCDQMNPHFSLYWGKTLYIGIL